MEATRELRPSVGSTLITSPYLTALTEYLSDEIAEVWLFPVDRTCWQSRLFHYVSRALGQDTYFQHCALRVNDTIFEYTWHGATWCDVRDYPPMEDMGKVRLKLTIPADLIAERFNAFVVAGTRLNWFDLVRHINGLPAHGLVCTSFVLMLLGYEPEVYTVDDLAVNLMCIGLDECS